VIDRNSSIITGVIIAIYTAARFCRLADSCLWFDEIFSVHAAEHSWGEIFNFLALDLIHPPLFYLLLKFWMGIGGDGVFWLRLLPVLISFLAVFPFVKLCREMRIDLFAIIFALFLIATNGALIKYAQEVRMYSLLMCLSLFSMWLFVRLGNRGKGLIGLAIVNLLMVYTHYFGWLVIAAEIVAAAILYRHLMRRMLGISTGTVVAFLPWLIAIILASRQGSDVKQNIGWMSRPGIYEVFQFVLDTVEPFYQQSTSADAGAIYLVAVPILLLVIAGIIAGLFAPSRADDKTVKVLVVLVIIPIVLAFLASWLSPLSIWGTRHLIIVFAPLAILIGHLTFQMKATWMKDALAATTVLLAAVSFSVVMTKDSVTNSWCVADDFARQAVETNEPKTIYALEDLVAYHVWFATRHNPGTSVKVIKGIPGMKEDAAYFLPRGFGDVESVVAGEHSVLANDANLIFRLPKSGAHRPGIESLSDDSPLVRELNALGLRITATTHRDLPGESVYLVRLTAD